MKLIGVDDFNKLRVKAKLLNLDTYNLNGTKSLWLESMDCESYSDDKELCIKYFYVRYDGSTVISSLTYEYLMQLAETSMRRFSDDIFISGSRYIIVVHNSEICSILGTAKEYDLIATNYGYRLKLLKSQDNVVFDCYFNNEYNIKRTSIRDRCYETMV